VGPIIVACIFCCSLPFVVTAFETLNLLTYLLTYQCVVVAAAGALIRTPENTVGLRKDSVILDCASNSSDIFWLYNGSSIITQNCTPSDSRFTATGDSNSSHCSAVIPATSRTRLNGPYFCVDQLEFAQAVVIIIGKA